MNIFKMNSFTRIYAIDCFSKEFQKQTNEILSDKLPYSRYQKWLLGRLAILDNEGKKAILYKEFEQLSDVNPPMYSIRFLKKEKNLRVIYAISEDEDIILLTVFCEKSSNDYERYIKVAKKRWKFLNE